MTLIENTTHTAQGSDKVALLTQSLIETRAEIVRAEGRMKIEKLQRKLNVSQRRLAVLFGQSRGWRLSRSAFSPTVLARNGLFDGRGYHFEYWPRELVDHGYFYRKNRLAIGVASHLYGDFHEAKRQEIEALAAHYGLKAEWPEDFPSWWVPGGTRLVVYTALVDRKQI